MDELPAENLRLYEFYKDIINREVGKRIHRWRLTSLAYLDWLDISQLLHLHTVTKIHLYDPEKSPFLHWINRLLSNRLKNLLRDHYQSFAKPCDKCEFNGGGNICKLYGLQSIQCDQYSHWFSNKRYKMNIAMAHSISAPRQSEEHDRIHQEINDKTSDFTDFDRLIPEFELLLKQSLKPTEWKTYVLLFNDHLTDLQAAKELGYSCDGGKNSRGVKAVGKIKTKIYSTAKEIARNIEY